MNFGGLMIRSALRSKRRSFLTAGSIAVSIFLLVTLLTIMRELTVPYESDASVRRVITRHKASLATPLPARYLETISQIPGVELATPMSWFGGTYIDESHFFARFAVDPEGIFQAIEEFVVEPEVVQAFARQRDACVVAAPLLRRENLRIGDRVKISGDIYPVDLDLEIVGSFTLTDLEEADTRLMFHHKLLEELMGEDFGQVGTVIVLVRSKDDVDRVTKLIDGTFANTEAETLTQTEKQFQASFVNALGNIKVLVLSICSVVVLTIFIVVASVIAMTVRERRAEIAVFKTLGMKRSLIFSLLVSESVLIALLGGMAGLALSWFMLSNIPIAQMTGGMLFKLEVTTRNASLCLLVSLLVGFFAALVPAYNAARHTVLAGLRAVD